MASKPIGVDTEPNLGARLCPVRRIPNLPVPTFVVSNPLEAAQTIAEEISRQMVEQDDFVLGCATGHTPIATYRELEARALAGLDFSKLRCFNLDEYRGLAAQHSASFEAFMRRYFFDPVGIEAGRFLFPRLEAGASPEEAAAEFEQAIRAAGGIDLQLLGIGRNGHIAFNEPGSPRNSRTRLVQLDPSTREANARDFPADTAVPTEAMTMGIGTILEARRLRVLAFGAHKSQVVARALKGPMTAELPASFLREHEDVQLWLDEEAAQEL